MIRNRLLLAKYKEDVSIEKEERNKSLNGQAIFSPFVDDGKGTKKNISVVSLRIFCFNFHTMSKFSS